jgi:hypothetical protein
VEISKTTYRETVRLLRALATRPAKGVRQLNEQRRAKVLLAKLGRLYGLD